MVDQRSAVGIGFRVKSGWAAFVALAELRNKPVLLSSHRFEMSSPENTETVQPYHRSAGALETDTKAIEARIGTIIEITKYSVSLLIAELT